MKRLNVDPENNKFVYNSDEPCVLPTNKAPGTQQPSGKTDAHVGKTGTDMSGTGGILGRTGSTQGRIFVLK